ncbi:5-hydroxytryptamine receptor 1A [Holothuria leucospilota]|uniref:5-hydroxytryptamine receptor 1A n=1 Tax=Holothuria leucospilota TaxID=206669 RepID=A0A9Q1HBC1_HOLLE|nr:5-hydroxytryptamine receptor 1A [Holothuria leucospilota]
MTCPERQKWLTNHSFVEFKDYHRPFLFPLEFMSLAFVLMVAVFLNFATIITILRVQSLRQKLGNMLIINLCVMDLITSLGSMLFSLIDIFYEGYFLCLDLFCRIHGGLAVVGCFGNFAAIITITFHRFLCVVAKDKVNLTSKHVVLLIVACWIFTLGLVIPPIGGNATSVYKHGTHHCSPTWSCPYFITTVVAIYALALPTLVICYSAIYWKVRSSKRRLILHKEKRGKDEECHNREEQTPSEVKRENIAMKTKVQCGVFLRDGSSQLDSGLSTTIENPSTTDDRKMSDQPSVVSVSGPYQSTSFYIPAYRGKKKGIRNHDVDIRIALAGGLIVVTTAVCWTPYFVVNSCTRNTENSHALSIFAMWIAYTNSALDPIIYSVLNKELQRGILNQVRLLCRFLQRNICRTN